jgi:glyoxylase-like metal-dependent hydrolase (beta-lactamase superfamily II)
VVYYHEADQVLLAGDLFTSRGGKLRPPMAMFTADMAQALRSGEIVQRLRPKRVEVCHGGPVLSPAEQ